MFSKEGEGQLEESMPLKKKLYPVMKAEGKKKPMKKMKSMKPMMKMREMPGMSWHAEVNCNQVSRKQAIPVDQILSQGVKANPFK